MGTNVESLIINTGTGYQLPHYKKNGTNYVAGI